MTTRKRTPGGIPASALAANISAGVTSLTLTTGDGASWPSTFPFDIIVNRTSSTSRERITVGGRTTDTLNSLTRGIDGTTAQSHNLGDSVEVCVAGSYLDELGQLLGGTAGDIFYYDGTALQKLAKGNARQRLISGTAPAWSYFSLPVYADATARDAEITVPSAGMAAYLDTGAATEGLYFYNGTAWRSVVWNAPWGVLATPIVRTTAQTAIGTSLTDLTGMTFTATAVGNRNWKITFGGPVLQNTGAGVPEIDLVTGASGAGTTIQTAFAGSMAAAAFTNLAQFTTVAPGAGSTSYHLRAKTSASTMDVNASATQPTQLVVEDIGPSGTPT